MVDTYSRIIFVHADNVGSLQFAEVRQALRGKAEMCMGKKTIMRRVVAAKAKTHPELAQILPLLRGNVGLVFTNEDLTEVRDILRANKKEAPAKAGAIAPSDVIVPAGPTPLDPRSDFLLPGSLHLHQDCSRCH
eukprot:gnl/Ergobibamus_cyprinoides/2816.p1 GENE.gnl/Ergobibamus_cyprinoides/2816~~gnl/Ergobibamus_cyprinoides/2816.p1  ORF type:complete len:134 (+),score=46.60 gnl/Ergobibamus_cyprinoides/2816:60-461(+)